MSCNGCFGPSHLMKHQEAVSLMKSEMNSYDEYLATKAVARMPAGIEPSEVSPVLFDFQQRVVGDALRRGRAALFLDSGLGKTVCQLEWARQVPGRVLILAPLAVAQQTVREAVRL